MKILIVTLGSIGELMPYLVVGTALRDRGHKVIFASNSSYDLLLRSSGFEFQEIWDRSVLRGGMDEALENDPDEAWRIVRRELYEAATKPAFDFIEEHARQEKCLVLASWSAFGAGLAHRKLDIPLCSAYLFPHAFHAAMEAPLAVSGDNRASSTERHVAFFPAWFCPRQQDWPQDVEITGFPMFDEEVLPALPEKLERFLDQGEPPVVFTPGTYMRSAKNFFRESLAACTAMNARGIFITHYEGQIPSSLPPTIMHLKYVPLQAFLGRTAALAYHGGIGTCAHALKAGIPHLVMPSFFDQFDNANRVEAMGVGKVIASGHYTARNVMEKLDELRKSDAVKQNCARIRGAFGLGHPVQDICEIIESMA